MKICFEVKERERESRLMIEIKEEGEIKRECDQRLGERKREKTKKKNLIRGKTMVRPITPELKGPRLWLSWQSGCF